MFVIDWTEIFASPPTERFPTFIFLVFDLDSLTANFDQESWDNFRQFLLMLDGRDFETLLISVSIEAFEWESFAKLTVLQSTAENAFQNNPALSAKDVFWFSEQPELQKKISRISQNFAGSVGCTLFLLLHLAVSD